MEVASIIYRAKDGRLFHDPLECEEYEKTIGILPGTVGALIKNLEELSLTDYIMGLVVVKEEECCCFYRRETVCCDSLLEDFVNVKELTKEQRYLYETVGDFIEELKKTNKDYPCQYMLAHSSNINMRPSAVMSNYNEKVWKKDKESNNI